MSCGCGGDFPIGLVLCLGRESVLETKVMRKGQALIEYVLSTASLIVVIGVLWGFVEVVERYAVRTENLVSSEYP